MGVKLKQLLAIGLLSFGVSAFAIDTDGDGLQDSYPNPGLFNMETVSNTPVLTCDAGVTGSRGQYCAYNPTPPSGAPGSPMFCLKISGGSSAASACRVTLVTGSTLSFKTFRWDSCFGSFYLDGQQQSLSVPNIDKWGGFSKSVAPGTHTLEWRVWSFLETCSIHIDDLDLSLPVADSDDDNDGVLDVSDNCPLHANVNQLNTDGDAQGNACDGDDDNDLMPDEWEGLLGFNPLVNDANGDNDGDGTSNYQEYLKALNPRIRHNVQNDYDDDGIAGWIWKGAGNGYETVSQNWQLTFPLYSANWAIPKRFYHPVFPDQANWEIMTSGDFNGDGDADILWRHKTDNQWKVWQMQNGERRAQNYIFFDQAHEWTVIGTGDTDGDIDQDIILNNAATGEVMIWEVQDHNPGPQHLFSTTKPGYIVTRIGDFNGDGDVDLLLSQVGGTTLFIWEIQNNNFVQERSFSSTGAGYTPVCAADFDGDGSDDIMLINSITQQEKWFHIQSYTRIAQYFGAINTGFVFLGCGDYDGDGDADSLWQRSSDNKIRAVLQQNYGSTKQTVYTNAFGGVNPGAAGYGFVYRSNGN